MEMQLRQGMDVQTPAQFIAHVTGGSCQTLQRVLHGVRLVVQDREENLCVCVIRRDLDFRDRHHADTRVFQLEGDDFRQIALDLILHALTAGGDGLAMFRHIRLRRDYLQDSEATTPATRKTRAGMLPSGVLQRSCDFLYFKYFELVAFLNVVEILQRQTAFETRLDFLDIVLETLQRIEVACPDDDVVAQQTY